MKAAWAIPYQVIYILLCFDLQYLETNVTRFGEILPLWQNILRLWQHFYGLFSILEMFEPILPKT